MFERVLVRKLTPAETQALAAKLDSMLSELSAKEEDVVRRALIREGVPLPSWCPEEDVAWWTGDVGY